MVRWLKIVRIGYLDNFGIVAKGSCVKETAGAFTQLSALLGLDSEARKSERGSEI